METQRTLLEKIKDPLDGLAWQEFVNCYSPLIFNFARGRGLQNADAADVCQEVMSIVARAMPDFRYDPERGSFRAWLYTITRRRISRHLRTQQREKRSDLELDSLPETEIDGGFREAWDEEWKRHLLDRAIARVKSQVGAQQWEIFWRTAVLEENPTVVAEVAGTSREAVYMARSRITARMRDALRNLEDGE